MAALKVTLRTALRITFRAPTLTVAHLAVDAASGRDLKVRSQLLRAEEHAAIGNLDLAVLGDSSADTFLLLSGAASDSSSISRIRNAPSSIWVRSAGASHSDVPYDQGG